MNIRQIMNGVLVCSGVDAILFTSVLQRPGEQQRSGSGNGSVALVALD